LGTIYDSELMEEKITRPTDYFGVNLAIVLAGKISLVHKGFDKRIFTLTVKQNCHGKSLTQRVEFIADCLKLHLPNDYKKAVTILIKIMGQENLKETGMFKEFYWLMPVGKFIEKYGLEHFGTSIDAIEELTKRNTGEYAIRPFINRYPTQTLKQMKLWAKSENFHLRRLASEGLRPKLPWAAKLHLFIENPTPVFEILDILKTEHIKFVKKSVANNLTDYIKVNSNRTFELIDNWKVIDNEHTQWIINYATRKLKKSMNP
jgi:3-methyladenine DNA glycosylase AlkC